MEQGHRYLSFPSSFIELVIEISLTLTAFAVTNSRLEIREKLIV